MVDAISLIDSMSQDFIDDESLAQSMSLPGFGSENELELLSNDESLNLADFGDTFEHPLERTLFEIEDDHGIDAAIQRVTICNIIYGKTVETADAMARLCFAYQDAGFHEQVQKHLLLLKAAAEGRPGARMESGSGNELVKAKIDLVAAGHFRHKNDFQR
ncbi:Oidioi.mRNA.OKI2018_I69.chr2.g5276.t1.cds [Oikopleura dioica]|uniref:Oidioi.mRNA.OKI2018_I69.chr2.g5276.t1.cds n=1 Tax=Oikopleura dioica TaxID=34765 RepID=A0ABN7T380_OIKDI|nr:Oidioi.mRNA.OKI2018_I69.chr2.g5276.t1.cds [Oikopleura dioica]